MKQFLSMLLVFSMLFTCALPAAAGEAVSETTAAAENVSAQGDAVPQGTDPETTEGTVPETTEETIPETTEEVLQENADDLELLAESPTTTMSVADILKNPDQLLEEYVMKAFYATGAAAFGTTSHDELTAYGRLFYDEMMPQIQKVAAGEDNQTCIVVKRSYSAKELGLSKLWDGNDFTPQARETMDLVFPTRAVVRAMLRDMPYEFYWQDEGRGVNWRWSSGGTINYSDRTKDVANITYTIVFNVAKPYALVNGKKDEKGGWIETDYAKTGYGSRAQRAGETARNVVAEYDSLTDIAKLTAYKEYICGEVTYDHNAAQQNPNDFIGSDAWQLVNAFDGDPSTNIVCEGYSKAFQYLCYLSSFQNDVTCMQDYSGNHMWNVVEINGIRLLADVTNSDDGTVGQNGGLFLVPVRYNMSSYYACGVEYVKGYLYGPADVNAMLGTVELEIPAPVAGEKPQTVLEGISYLAKINWSPACKTFEERTVYTATVTVQPAEAPFKENLSLILNGNPVTFEWKDLNAVAEITFPATEGTLTPGWNQENGRWMYVHEDGSFTTNDFEHIGNRWYFFDDQGYTVTGWKQVGKVYYYFDYNGYMAVGWRLIGGQYYYFSGTGAMVTGWKTIAGKYYYFKPTGAMAANTWIGDSYVGADGAWDPNAAKPVWKKDSNGWKYVYADGSFPKDNFAKIGNRWYYFNEEGYMITGWKQVGKTNYYFDGNGYMAIGWKQIDGEYYFFTGSGAMATGWRQISGKHYYFKSNGVMATNSWIGDSYVGADGAWDPTAVKAGWKKENAGWKYIHADGSFTKDDFEKIGSRWHYFDADGYMVTGWMTVDTDKYYFDGNGYMIIGWKQIDGAYYFFSGTGAMVTGWKTIGGEKYYFGTDGVMATDTWIEDSYVGPDGAWDPDAVPANGRWEEDENGRRYVHNDGTYTTYGFEEIDGCWYFFDQNGYMYRGWMEYHNEDLDRRMVYYMDDLGHMATGTCTVDGIPHDFAANGELMGVSGGSGSYDVYTVAGTVSGTVNFDYAKQVLDMVNKERTARGLKPVVWSGYLSSPAVIRAAEISVSFSHTRPDGTPCFSISEMLNGENIAIGYANPQAVMNGWMNSQGHKDNILNPDFATLTVGCFIPDSGPYAGRLCWTQLFGR